MVAYIYFEIFAQNCQSMFRFNFLFVFFSVRLVTLAYKNIQRVNTLGDCSVPTKRCFPVVQPNKILVPRCALIHRCGEDSGCCHKEGHVCSPIAHEIVHLYFYYYQVGVLYHLKLNIKRFRKNRL